MSTTPHSLFSANFSGQWIETIYQEWRSNPDSVARDWQNFFNGFELGFQPSGAAPSGLEQALKLSAVQSLIYRYRSIGHLLACTDPLSPCQLEHPQLALAAFGLNESDLHLRFSSRRFFKVEATLEEIVAILRQTYCREIGVEFMHIQDPDERQWLIDRMEPCRNVTSLNQEQKLHILHKLNQAALFEAFLQRRFTGQKRFSLEGGEVLIAVLDAVVASCPGHAITRLVMGMAHRGRLNVLAHIFGKPYQELFAEFRDGMAFGFFGDGDVKYHRGFSTDIELADGRVHLTLAANPSHLEAVNPVVEGKCRAQQDRIGSDGARQVLPLLIHGDAAFAGQGSIMETLNMSRLEGYRTGGTLHLVINNQIGFTTLPEDARSTRYATDVAKMLECPIFHVQGEAPEAAVHAVRLALEYRQAFGRDVVLELICYRRHGHNEGDEPAFTQPAMYRQIAGRPSVNRIYATTLAQEGVPAPRLAESERNVQEQLETAFPENPSERTVGFQEYWSEISREFDTASVDTAVQKDVLLELARGLAELPPGFTPHPKVEALLRKRLEAVLQGGGIDWGGAEMLAYASLVSQGTSVRLSGQDSRRGTFNHRHAVLHDQTSQAIYIPLAGLAQKGASFQAWNSLLSEMGVLGFEYGYSLETPRGLVIWEAQFGDFANSAQVIIDQFISSGETKWNRASGLVLMLPHGYEGQGAEHSSARIERYLQLCARENLLVANPTTPAQLFHLLRRQVRQSFRKPLVIFTPKSLLRHPRCVSTVDNLSSGDFAEVLVDVGQADRVRQVMLCSGKIYFELLEERERRQRDDLAIVRIEQLYPFREDVLSARLAEFPEAECLWVQEEPENMGALPFLRPRLERLRPLRVLSRPEDCCPAVGSHRLHVEQQTALINQAFQLY